MGGRALGERLPGGEAVAGFADVPAEAFAVPVFDEVEEPDPAVLDGPDFGAVGGPAHIGRVGDDAAVVGLGRGEGGAVRGKQPVGAHEAPDGSPAHRPPLFPSPPRRLRPTLCPATQWRRAWTLRWPSPMKGEAARSARMRARRASSSSTVFGPRLA